MGPLRELSTSKLFLILALDPLEGAASCHQAQNRTRKKPEGSSARSAAGARLS